ncbi:MAG TPA: elongation factor P [Bacilli bacterium]|nr:elongation factor P [Bacilli bacterium]HPZ24105.1 elongation factor P [Bacilli bacterium]HQC83442.1 elongation factor P [Bacilli bacterium]
MISINDIKNGMTIIVDGKLCMIEDFQHVKPGKGSAFMRMKLRNLRTGALVENTYNTNITVERARVDRLPMQYLYADGSKYVFMNTETYDQMEIEANKIGDQVNFLKENLDVTISMYEGEILGIQLPEKVEYEVIETQEATKGNTTNNAQKDAKIETGYTIKVPLFINQGEKIVVTTSDGKYAGRA